MAGCYRSTRNQLGKDGGEIMTTQIDLSTLQGSDTQKLEALSFLRANASRKIDRLERAGSITKLQTAKDEYEAICYEITKHTK